MQKLADFVQIRQTGLVHVAAKANKGLTKGFTPEGVAEFGNVLKSASR